MKFDIPILYGECPERTLAINVMRTCGDVIYEHVGLYPGVCASGNQLADAYCIMYSGNNDVAMAIRHWVVVCDGNEVKISNHIINC